MTLTSGQLEREMRLRESEIIIEDYTKCYYCNSTGLNEQDKFCPNCRFPQRGTQFEMKGFLNSVKKKKQLLEDKKKSVKKARNILFILAGLNLILGLIIGAILNFDAAIILGSVIGALIYFVLGMWSRKNPFAAILSGFFVYIVFLVLGAISDPESIYRGLLFKIIIIYGFIYGFKGVKDSEKLELELKSINESKDLAESSAV